MYLAIRTRRVNTSFAESKWIGLCIYNMCLVFAFILPILTLDNLSVDNAYVVRSVGVFLIFGGVLFLIFGPKFVMIWTGSEISIKDFFNTSMARTSKSPASAEASGMVRGIAKTPNHSSTVSTTRSLNPQCNIELANPNAADAELDAAAELDSQI